MQLCLLHMYHANDEFSHVSMLVLYAGVIAQSEEPYNHQRSTAPALSLTLHEKQQNAPLAGRNGISCIPISCVLRLYLL